MPRIDDEYLECSVYLYFSEADARAGERGGGTGFLVNMPFANDPNRRHVYIVTNSHVVRGGATVVRFNTIDGSADPVAIPDGWKHHFDGTDVAAVQVGIVPGHRQKHVPRSLFVTHEMIQQYNIGPGDECFFVGRFQSHDGKQRNIPSLRFGNIAMMPLEPIEHPQTGIKQESFLVEARSIAGFSGSPVFVFIPSLATRPGLTYVTTEELTPQLLGIDWCHLAPRQPVLERDGKTAVSEGWIVEQNSGMMGVIPAWKIAELLDDDTFVARRKEIEER